MEAVASVLSVNLARVRTNPDPRAQSKLTGIDKVAATEGVMVRAPGPMHGGVGSGLVGDTIGNQKLHGGDDQAVYVYAREDLDAWEIQLQRTLSNGNFGENLTTSGIDVTAARIGERWRIGTDGLVAGSLRSPDAVPDVPGLPESEPLDQNLHPGGETGRLLAGDFAWNRAHRRRNHNRSPPRSRRDHWAGLPRPNVRTGAASSAVGRRRAVSGAQGLRAPPRRFEHRPSVEVSGTPAVAQVDLPNARRDRCR